MFHSPTSLQRYFLLKALFPHTFSVFAFRLFVHFRFSSRPQQSLFALDEFNEHLLVYGVCERRYFVNHAHPLGQRCQLEYREVFVRIKRLVHVSDDSLNFLPVSVARFS